MDESRDPPNNDEPVDLPIERDEQVDGEPAASPAAAEVGLPELERPSRQPLTGSAGGAEWRRWRLYGCAAGALGLIALLAFGTHMLRNTVWLTYRNAHQRVVVALADASPPDRMRTIQNLDAFTETLQSMDEPYALMGEFQRRVNDALEDGRLDRTESADLNDFLEQSVADQRLE